MRFSTLLLVAAVPFASARGAITPERILEHTRALADDALQGRGPGTEGDRKARAYIVAKLQALGFEPGGPDGSWEQRFQLMRIEAHAPATWTVAGPKGRVDLQWWKDYIASSGVQRDRAAFEAAELVFVGYGIEAPAERWDDFKGADLRGKVLVFLNNDPDWDPVLFAGKKRLYYGRWTYKYEIAAKRGAAGAIIIHTDASAGYGWNVVQSSWTGPQFELPEAGEPRVAIKGWLTHDAARRVVAAAGRDLAVLERAARRRDFKPVPLGVTTALRLQNQVASIETGNVLGLLRGSDPALAREVVVYTAHHDHLGLGEPDSTGDRIYNGALDNASGVGQVLAIAEAFAGLAERPKRSVLIAAVAAEEQGLLGSEYWCANPTFAAGRVAANINLDGGNIFGRTRDVAIVGRGKSSLEDTLAEAAKDQARVVVDEPDSDKGYYYRSDQLNFAKIGVPALYFRSGYSYIDRPSSWGKERNEAYRRNRYHQPSDEIDATWDLSGMAEDARLAFEVGRRVAAGGPMPAWYPGDEFESIRRKALAALEVEERSRAVGGQP